MNTFMSNLTDTFNYTRTENGALARRNLENDVYQMFSLGGAYRKRSNEDCILLFKNALEEDETLALKCLFYLRDCHGSGQGERRFFRVCYNWLAKEHSDIARRNLDLLSEYGRWDDLYCLMDTPLEEDALEIIKKQLALDIRCKTPSLLAKWLKSENTSSPESRALANKTREYLNMSHKQYRKTLSLLREKIKVLERLMSTNRWDEIVFDAIPSKAGLIYKNAFARRDIIAKKYEAFAKSKETKVNAATLYPYDVVSKAIGRDGQWAYRFSDLTDVDRAMINKYWENLPDYLEGKPCKMMCVIDTSGSMTCGNADAPLNVAIGLGMYCAERIGGPFKNHFISFSRNPQLIEIEGIDFVDKARRIYCRNECSNTDLIKTFRLLKNIAMRSNVEDIPDTLVIISDMQIDQGSFFSNNSEVRTEMEHMREEWVAAGLKMPRLVYWDVDARGNANFLDNGPDVTYVSGCSPTIFTSVLTGKTGWELCLEVLNGKRYEAVK